MKLETERVVIGLQLSPARYGTVAVVGTAMGLALAHLSLQPTLVSRGADAKAASIGRVLMTVAPIGGVWPLAAAGALAFLAAALFLVWALVARRRFELAMDGHEVTWPSLAPWRAPWVFAWSEVASVAVNPARDHLVFMTTRGRRVLPAWWLPAGTSVEDVVRAATELRTRAARSA